MFNSLNRKFKALAPPGFFDAHGHISAAPLTVTIEDGAAYEIAELLEMRKQFLTPQYI